MGWMFCIWGGRSPYGEDVLYMGRTFSIWGGCSLYGEDVLHMGRMFSIWGGCSLYGEDVLYMERMFWIRQSQLLNVATFFRQLRLCRIVWSPERRQSMAVQQNIRIRYTAVHELLLQHVRRTDRLTHLISCPGGQTVDKAVYEDWKPGSKLAKC